MSTHQRLVSSCLAIKVVAGKGKCGREWGHDALKLCHFSPGGPPPLLTLMCFGPISVINNVVLDGLEAI